MTLNKRSAKIFVSRPESPASYSDFAEYLNVRWWRFFFAFLLAAAIFLADLSTPLGVAGGVPYVALVLFGLWFHHRSWILGLGAV
jgi:hypothetical protein